MHKSVRLTKSSKVEASGERLKRCRVARHRYAHPEASKSGAIRRNPGSEVLHANAIGGTYTLDRRTAGSTPEGEGQQLLYRAVHATAFMAAECFSGSCQVRMNAHVMPGANQFLRCLLQDKDDQKMERRFIRIFVVHHLSSLPSCAQTDKHRLPINRPKSSNSSTRRIDALRYLDAAGVGP